MKAIWKGWLSFGLINIPVQLYSGVREKEISFHLLHEKDNSPIRYARICKKEGKEVAWEEIAKGYQLESGRTIVLTEKDFEKAAAEYSKTIEILDFIKLEEIDPIYFDKPYFLEPQKGAGKAYALLREALKKSKKAGIVKFVLRNKEHLGAIKAHQNYLILDQMRFVHEMRDLKKLNVFGKEKLSAREMEMALQLIDHLTKPFRPQMYKDRYREEIVKIIKNKSKGKKRKVSKVTKNQDLAKALKISLQKRSKKLAA